MTMNNSLTRRSFLRESSSTAALFAAATSLGGVHALGAENSSPLKVGIIGCGGIMGTHVRRIVRRPKEVSIAWLCDVDPAQIARTEGMLRGGTSPRTTARYEDVLADDKVDAVFIATPNHWHTPMAVAAMAAGKDVYLEKPATHTFAEGQVLMEAAKKSKCVFQHGIQMRSSPVADHAFRLLKEGVIGEVQIARAWSAEVRPVRPAVPDSAPPAGVDYDRWLGPAPDRDFNALRFHKSWRLFRDYSNGDIGDDGVHNIDMAIMALGVEELPIKVTARGGRLMKGHAGEFPDNMNVTYEYPDGRLLHYDAYPTTPSGIHNIDNGNAFYGTEGYMIFSIRGFFNVYLGPKAERGPTEEKQHRGNRGYDEHLTDFLTAVRQRTPTRSQADVAHRCSALAHLANIATLTQGHLEFDPTAGKFRNSNQANALLTKEYRKPYGLA
jgi:predicted dehydrogenase